MVPIEYWSEDRSRFKVSSQLPLTKQPESNRLSLIDDSNRQQVDDLRADNPAISRVLDCSHALLESAEGGLGWSDTPAMQVWNGSVATMATIWGANRLVNGEGWVDKVEGIGHLALAAESGLRAAKYETSPSLNMGLGLIHAGGELVVGAVDAARGHQSGNKRRVVAGICQFTVGLAAASATMLPTLGPLASIAMVGATVVRQVALGAP